MADGALVPDEELKVEPQPGDVEVTGEIGALAGARQAEMTGTPMAAGTPELAAYKDKKAYDSRQMLEDDKIRKSEKDVDLDGKKDSLWKRFKYWGGRGWNKGKDDPLTPEREDETEEVTRFMGGMTRQELGMFIFQWGGLMMQNAEEGFGGAMGAASLGALEGHQQRGASAQAGALEERQVAAQEMSANAALTKAKQGTVPKLEEVADGFIYHDGENWVYATNPDGSKIPPPENSANRPFAPQALQAQLEATGFFNPQEIAMLVSNQPGTGEVRSDALRAWERRMTQDIYPNGMRLSDWRALPDSEKDKLRQQFIDSYVNEYSKAYTKSSEGSGGGTPPATTPTVDAGKDATDQYDE